MGLNCPATSRTVALFAAVLAVPLVAGAEDDAEGAAVSDTDTDVGSPRVVLVDVLGNEPPLEEVVETLASQLQELGVIVETVPRDGLPSNAGEWAAAAGEVAASGPGTLLLVGYQCADREGCSVVLTEPRSGALAELRMPVEGAGEADLVTAIAVAIREALIADLPAELDRLSRGVAGPPEALDQEAAEEPPAASESQETGEEQEAPARSFLRVEGGYHGEHAHPDGQPLHGPWLGLAIEPREVIDFALAIGWLGIREGENPFGSVRTHHATAALSVRLKLGVGPAKVSLAPVGRLDLVFAEADPAGPEGPGDMELEVELNVGGICAWHLPLPGGLEALLGVGLLATVLGRDYEVEDTVAIPESRLRIHWRAGVSWGAL